MRRTNTREEAVHQRGGCLTTPRTTPKTRELWAESTFFVVSGERQRRQTPRNFQPLNTLQSGGLIALYNRQGNIVGAADG